MMKATTTKGAVVWMMVLLIALLSQATPPAHAERDPVGTEILNGSSNPYLMEEGIGEQRQTSTLER